MPIYVDMRELPLQPGTSPEREEVEISLAAIGGFRRLRRVLGGAVKTHGSLDGGLICEDRSVRTRPTIWRISPDGAVLADSPYNYATRTFSRVKLPQGV